MVRCVGVRRLGVALLPGIAYMAWFIWSAGYDGPEGRRFTLIDDAMISMTYARTLAQTGEWVWFPGADRVQGITNPLWSLVMAGVHWFGLEGSPAALTMSLLGVAIVLGCSLLTAGLLYRNLPHSPLRTHVTLLGAGMVPFIYPLTFWTLRGVEVGILALFTLGAIVAAEHAWRAWQGGRSAAPALASLVACGALGIATRMDFAPVIGAIGLLVIITAPSLRARVGTAAGIALPLTAALAAVLIFQQLYWGDWLPNTYYLKVEGATLTERLLRGLFAMGKLLPTYLLMGASLTVLVRSGPRRWLTSAEPGVRLAVALALPTVVTAAYSMWVGGDAFEGYYLANRYVSPALPPASTLILLAGDAWYAAHAASRKRLLAWGILALLFSGAATGLRVNPHVFSVGNMILHATMILPVCLFVHLAYRRGSPTDLRAGREFTSRVAVLAVACISLPQLFAPLAGRPPAATTEDALFDLSARKLAQITTDSAVLAVGPAGSTGYYAGRRMLDAMGKSDSHIAHLPAAAVPPDHPYSSFFPGHNKWDLDYTLGALRPDLAWGVAQFGFSPAKLADWGYQTLCLSGGTPHGATFPDVPVFVRTDSKRVDRSALAPCSP